MKNLILGIAAVAFASTAGYAAADAAMKCCCCDGMKDRMEQMKDKPEQPAKK